MFASVNQRLLHPGSGLVQECGAGEGFGYTVNLPLPPMATDDVVCVGFNEVVGPAVEVFSIDWLFISAGFDGPHADSIVDPRYSLGEFADFIELLRKFAPPRRTIAVLERGYYLNAVRASTAATAALLVEKSTRLKNSMSGRPGRDVGGTALRLHHEK